MSHIYDTAGDEPSVSRTRNATLPRRLTLGSSQFGQSRPENAPTGLWNSGHARRPSTSAQPTTPNSSASSGSYSSSTLTRSPALPSHLTMNYSSSQSQRPTDDASSLSKEEQEEEAKLIAKEKTLTWENKQKMKDTNVKVREEILSTERNYVEQLQLFSRAYAQSFTPEVCKQIGIDNNQKTALISNIDLLANFHIQFLADLDASGIDEIEKVFIKYSAFFRMYSTYSSNYQKCVDTIHEFRANKLFQEHMDHVCAKLGENIMSFMIRPVQRIPRYVLLLRELRRHTLPSAPQFKVISNALAKVSETAMHINNFQRQIENTQILMSLEKRLSGDFGDLVLIQPYRKLIHEGEVIFREAKKNFFGTIKESTRILFLFNDILLWTNKNFEFKNYAYIVSIRLESLDDLHFQMQNSSIHIIVKCSSKENKDFWMSEIGNQHQEQAKARVQKLAVKRANANSIRSTTHNKILDSFQQLHDRNTLSRREAEAFKAQMASQNNDTEISKIGSEISTMAVSDNVNHLDNSLHSPSSLSTNQTSSAALTTPSSTGGYRTRIVQPRSMRSGRTTAGATLVDKFNSDLSRSQDSTDN